ncbi:PmoA family protein [Arthrobacter castelli]|uniref:DUF6807 domain-containing protein n=1 Tax=Arthrobacter castelli TaxID=271431 RepID=UPI00047D03E1|nr:PmoA family protein [Arthrobacter castelli]
MPESLSLRRTDDSLIVKTAGVDIARYVFEPTAPTAEAPKPFLHPLRTLRGAPLSVHRPWDHRWHKGLQMTWSHVSDANFWGGPTYSRDGGYQWRDNLGSIRHETFTSVTDTGPEVSFAERLQWVSPSGDQWMDETRTHSFNSVDSGRGIWALDFSSTLQNVSGKEIELGSPTTHGREAAGYAGFFWRGPRAWTGGRVRSSASPADGGFMGSKADWLALSGEHDDFDGGGTVLVYAGSSSAQAPIKWFVRNEPFAAISPSPSFDEEVVLSHHDTLQLRHRYVFIDSYCDDSDLTRLAMEFTP